MQRQDPGEQGFLTGNVCGQVAALGGPDLKKWKAVLDDKGGAAKYTSPTGVTFAKEAALLHLGLIAAVTRSEAAANASAYRNRSHPPASPPHPLRHPPLPRA